MTEAQARATRIGARIIGPYFIVLAGTLLTQQHAIALVFPAFMQDAPLVLSIGALTLLAGLTLMALHHHWSSPAAIAVSLSGVMASLKGASLMVAPEFGAELTAATVRAPLVLQVAALIVLVLGAWLTFVGWFARTQT